MSLLLVAVAILIDSSNFGISACACITYNKLVLAGLNYLEKEVGLYASENAGSYPTYEYVLDLAEGKSFEEYMTNSLIVSDDFEFIGMGSESVQVVYVVSSDGSKYILRGMGLSERHQIITLFGIEIMDKKLDGSQGQYSSQGIKSLRNLLFHNRNIRLLTSRRRKIPHIRSGQAGDPAQNMQGGRCGAICMEMERECGAGIPGGWASPGASPQRAGDFAARGC